MLQYACLLWLFVFCPTSSSRHFVPAPNLTPLPFSAEARRCVSSCCVYVRSRSFHFRRSSVVGTHPAIRCQFHHVPSRNIARLCWPGPNSLLIHEGVQTPSSLGKVSDKFLVQTVGLGEGEAALLTSVAAAKQTEAVSHAAQCRETFRG